MTLASVHCRREGVPIRDWADLLQPRLEGRLGFLDSPREFIGVALKTLGLPFNCSHAQLTKSTVSLQQLKARVKQLRQQVRVARFLCISMKSAASFSKAWAFLVDVMPDNNVC